MLAIIGCGNPNRSDDGAGPEVLRRLDARGLASDKVRLLDAGTDGMAVMFAARGCDSLIIVDACRSGAQPGAIFSVPGARLEKRHERALNLHDFRWESALHAGRQIFLKAFPVDVEVLLIEAGTLEYGIGLSTPVAESVGAVADRLEERVRAQHTKDDAS